MVEYIPTTVEGLTTLVHQLLAENETLHARIEELEKKLVKNKIDPPPIVKPNVPMSLNQKRRKARNASFVRTRSAPDEIRIHAYDYCPDCGTPVCGASVAYEREIIDVPPVKPITTLHRIIKRHCMGCGKWVTPSVDFSSLVVGHARFGVGIMSMVTTLRECGRLPVRMVQKLMTVLYGLRIASGEIISVSHRVAARGHPTYDTLHAQVCASPCVHADETGHRENGRSGYIWNFTTPTIRYYVYQRSRTKDVVDDVLGSDFYGLLTTDFYTAYNHLMCAHQRCWAHLLRDIKKLLLVYPEKLEELCVMKNKMTGIFNRAKRMQATPLLLSERHMQRRTLETTLLTYITPYLKQKDHPFHTLAKRMDYYLDELFTFMLDPEWEPTNNAAERALRHQVIKRKISGGTRSAKGSRTQEIITTLWSTWTLNHLNPLTECQKLLTHPNYATSFVQEL